MKNAKLPIMKVKRKQGKVYVSEVITSNSFHSANLSSMESVMRNLSNFCTSIFLREKARIAMR